MKKLKKTLLGTTFAGILVASAGIGTYSWFTSETEAQGDMQNGVLQINNDSNIETPIFSGVKFAPSQLEYGNWVTIENSGDLDTYLNATYTHSIDKASLDAYEVGYMAMKYTTTPDQDTYEKSKIQLENLFNGETNERTFTTANTEGVELSGELLTDEEVDSGEITFGEGSEDSFWQLDEGQYIDIMIAIKLDESAGNEYQGAQYDATFHVIGKQTDDGATYE
ncbi:MULTISPECIES: hypothetical protein [Virgibacillus]|uniref:Spore coat-associated protein N n=2 Tax=Virgibacillus TaxID=84406 RepID=A0A024Q6D5_9BACI|nr:MULTISPECIES: hypothetical protein [Virgibacillus]EQB38691.1 hypothetical protein M948_08890 [Virgibacillus sp. CM-4]MYL41405.1 hypothetical protein [Virgibacillus massiliensis]GGJ56914.1 hypothetical protein GCM10007111_18830 [Virgibacillus kapii]CDQ37800.1 hypothetical protein BN990_00056 [Virgibacillus massiliensis]